MKVFVCTTQGQGERSNDFCFVPEGEVVKLTGHECDSDRDDPDGRCGCSRSACGVLALTGTTTFMLVDRPDIDRNKLKELMIESYSGWRSVMSEQDINEAAEADVEESIRLAEFFTTDEVLEKRGMTVQRRIMGRRNQTCLTPPNPEVSSTTSTSPSGDEPAESDGPFITPEPVTSLRQLSCEA